jgi:hypothetical protein
MGIDPIGNVHDVSPGPAGLHVAGWTIDPDTASSIDVHIYVDNAFAQVLTASGSRPDVSAAYPGYGSMHGFDLTILVAAGPHTVCVYGINVGPGTVNGQLGCRTAERLSHPFGSLDAVLPEPAGLRLSGWAIDPDSAGAIDVHLYVNGAFSRAVTADACCMPPHVTAQYYPAYGGAHAFRPTLETGQRGRYTVCAYGINVGPGYMNPELGCKTVTQSGGLPPAGGHVAVGGVLSFEPYPQPGKYVRLNGDAVTIAPIDGKTEMDASDAHFRKVSGLSAATACRSSPSSTQGASPARGRSCESYPDQRRPEFPSASDGPRG